MNLKAIFTFLILMLLHHCAFAAKSADTAFTAGVKFEFCSKVSADAPRDLKMGTELVQAVYRGIVPAASVDPTLLLRLINKNKNRPDIKRQLSKAIKLLDGVLAEAPDRFPEAFFIKGVAYMIAGDFSGALADFYSAMDMDVKNRDAAVGAYIALSYMWNTLSEEQKKEWGEQIAAKMSERLLVVEDKSADDYLLISRLFYLSKDYEKAYLMTEKGLELDSTSSALLSTRSLIGVDAISK